MFDKILVGTDGFGPASKAVERAVELGEGFEAEVVVVVARPPEPGAGGLPREQRPGIDAAEGLLHDVEKHYGDRVRLRTTVREGDPAEVLLDVAEEEGVDLIVVGNKGMSKRFHLGSVPNRVSHHASCHVLIAHTTDDRR